MSPRPHTDPVLVMVMTRSGIVQVAPVGDTCHVCHGDRVVHVWNVGIKDDVTFDLVPADKRIIAAPCPMCRPDEYDATDLVAGQDWLL